MIHILSFSSVNCTMLGSLSRGYNRLRNGRMAEGYPYSTVLARVGGLYHLQPRTSSSIDEEDWDGDQALGPPCPSAFLSQ